MALDQRRNVKPARSGGARKSEVADLAPHSPARNEDMAPRAEQILRLAAKLFHERGYGSVSIRDIGAATGVSSSTLYHHFKDKEELLFAINERFMLAFNDAMREAADVALGPADRMRTVIVAHVRFQQVRREDLLTANHFRRALSPLHRDRILQLMREYRSMVRAIADEGKASGDFSSEEPWVAVAMILDMVNGLREWYSPDGPYAMGQLAEEYGDAALRVLGAKPMSDRASASRKSPQKKPTGGEG